jgi:hypothetical protein
MWMSIPPTRGTVSGPAGVADGNLPCDGFAEQKFLEVDQLALLSAHEQFAVIIQHSKTG